MSNQNKIVESLFPDDREHIDENELLIIDFRQSENGYQIYIDEDGDGSKEWIDLYTLEKDSLAMNNGQTYQYFLAYLDLVANLCFQRNYKGIKALEQTVSFEIIFGCIQSKKLPYAMRGKFVDLILRLYIDKDPREPMQIPQLTRVWGEIDESPQQDNFPLNKTAGEDITHQFLKQFVKDYLYECAGQQKSFERSKNSMTHSILCLAKDMIIYGFYKSQDELKDVIDPLITLLDGSHDVTTTAEDLIIKKLPHFDGEPLRSLDQVPRELKDFKRMKSRYELNEPNIQVTKCKGKMCEILNIVMDIQNDIRISRFLLVFHHSVMNTKSGLN